MILKVRLNIAFLKIFCVLLLANATNAFGQLPYVAAVVDGDQVVLSDGRRLQLLGVNAPERQPSARMQREALAMGKSPEAYQQLGEISASFLGAMVLGNPVRVIPDVQFEQDNLLSLNVYTPVYIELLDQRGRVVASVNERMIEAGYASTDHRYGFERQSRFMALERQARARGVGFWAPEPGIQPVIPVKSRDAESTDPSSSCRDESGCVWISIGNTVNGPGYWTARIGASCSCQDQ